MSASSTVTVLRSPSSANASTCSGCQAQGAGDRAAVLGRRGPQTGFYYEDPDGSSDKINVSDHPQRRAAIEHMQTSPDFNRHRSESMSIPTRWSLRARRGQRPGNCISEPGRASSRRRTRSILQAALNLMEQLSSF